MPSVFHCCFIWLFSAGRKPQGTDTCVCMCLHKPLQIHMEDYDKM